MKKATLQTVARDVRAIARNVIDIQSMAHSVDAMDRLTSKRAQARKARQLQTREVEIGISIFDNEPVRLILLTKHIDGIEPASWADVQAFAKKHDASAPSRIDGLVLWQRAAKHFKTDLPYWTCEESAGSSAGAWGQWFSPGNQDGWLKDNKCRACLVRRLPI